MARSLSSLVWLNTKMSRLFWGTTNNFTARIVILFQYTLIW